MDVVRILEDIVREAREYVPFYPPLNSGQIRDTMAEIPEIDETNADGCEYAKKKMADEHDLIRSGGHPKQTTCTFSRKFD
jgi:hypothetical protein